jgi:hypothetical protein
MRLQLSDDGHLAEIEEYLNRAALAVDPSSIEVFQEASHFYDALAPNAQKARAICGDRS